MELVYINLKGKTVVFDGNTPSANDATRHGRSGKVSQLVKIHHENRCPSDRKDFIKLLKQTKGFLKWFIA